MSPHTPGPWVVSEWDIAEEDDFKISLTDCVTIDAFQNGDDEESECIALLICSPEAEGANATLLAAAPEMLAALEEQHTFLCYISEVNVAARNDSELLVHMGDKLRAAIARATGANCAVPE